MSTPTRAAAIAAVMSVLAIGAPVAAASAQTAAMDPAPIGGGIYGSPWGHGHGYPGGGGNGYPWGHGHGYPGGDGNGYPGGHGYGPYGYAPPHR